MLRNRWRIPRPFPEAATRRLIWQAKVLSRRLSVPVLLENLEPLYPGERHLESQPERIARVLESTDCGFLPDTGHARVAAAAHGLSIGDDVARLPLNRVVQVHLSGPRLRNGALVDVHEPLQEEDYALLDSLLAKTRPRVVTLEYIRNLAALREQLARLRGILDTHGS